LSSFCAAPTRGRVDRAIREHAAGLEQVEDLAIERVLAVMLDIVDGERRDDSVKASQQREQV